MITECWEYPGTIGSAGYGKFTIQGKEYLAHRVAWMHIHGTIPEGLVVRHKCDNPPCVNPDHLELGTHSDNARDRHDRGRFFNQNTFKTHCAQGHELSGDNLYVYPKGGRACKTCRSKWVRECRARKH